MPASFLIIPIKYMVSRRSNSTAVHNFMEGVLKANQPIMPAAIKQIPALMKRLLLNIPSPPKIKKLLIIKQNTR